MAPRRALGKRPHGSSVCTPQPPAPQLDEHWFRSLEAQARFPWFDSKNIESGRRVNLDQLDRFDVRVAFDALGWVPVISYTDTTRPNLVKHFYANLELHGDVNDPNQGRDLRISSYVKGVHISFDTHRLADLLGVPNDGDLVYCPPKVKGYLSEDLRREIAEQILNPGAPMKAASLKPLA
ncbi:hypothetical protein NE237_005705 [Protea cynaroides]|uniref:Uncharacterized protein n=1 Tax=Protea cynaroides TaxID=273540 RepID=A0A9Q0KLP9_9MAGN|nr:hypothetical protein NE237_005705 [Protea cynaroides]